MKYLMTISCLLLAVSCTYQKEEVEQISSIDSTLQEKVTSILEEKLKTYDALFGNAIVMEVQTGHVKALVGLEKIDSTYQSAEHLLCAEQPAGTSRIMPFMAMLESGKVHLNDTIDTGNGILPIGTDTIRDRNWKIRGGFGKMTALEGFILNSDVSAVLCLQKAFQNEEEYNQQLHKLPINKPDSIKGVKCEQHDYSFDYGYIYKTIGYYGSSPIQTIAFYNAIANNGKMVQPQIYKDSTITISPQIASKNIIKDIQQVLKCSVTEGLCKKAKADSVAVAGCAGALGFDDETFLLDFCGYFPAENPKYSILVTICKEHIPASGGAMAGGTFKEIVDYMVKESK